MIELVSADLNVLVTVCGENVKVCVRWFLTSLTFRQKNFSCSQIFLLQGFAEKNPEAVKAFCVSIAFVRSLPPFKTFSKTKRSARKRLCFNPARIVGLIQPA